MVGLSLVPIPAFRDSQDIWAFMPQGQQLAEEHLVYVLCTIKLVPGPFS